MQHLGLGALVRERDTLAHLSHVGGRGGRLGLRAGDRQPQQDRIAAHLLFEHRERPSGTLLFDQEIGIGERRIRVGLEVERCLERRFSGTHAAGSFFKLGQAGAQPGAGRGGLARVGEQAGESGARPVDIATKRAVLGKAGAAVQGGAGSRDLPARSVGVGVSPLHTAHGREGEPSLRARGAAGTCQQVLQVCRSRLEFMQVLLQIGTHQEKLVRRGRFIAPGRDRRERHASKAWVTQLVGLLEIALRDRQGERRVARVPRKLLTQPAGLCAIAGHGRQDFDHLVVAGRCDRRRVQCRQRGGGQRNRDPTQHPSVKSHRRGFKNQTGWQALCPPPRRHSGKTQSTVVGSATSSVGGVTALTSTGSSMSAEAATSCLR